MSSKLLISLIFFFTAFNLKAQFPAQSIGGSPKYKSTVPGVFGADSGLVLTTLSDTNRANISKNIKLTDGILFKSGTKVYMRDTATRQWINVTAGGDTSFLSKRINNKWSLTGDSISTGNFIGTNNDQDVVFKRYGSFAGYIDSLQKNTFLGVGVNQPGANTLNNTALGYYALHGNIASFNNTAVGTFSLQNLRGNDQNTAVGVGSGSGVLQSLGSTYVGYNAGSAITDHHYYSTFLGWNAGSTQLSGGNNIFIGAGTQPNISITGSNQLNIGNWIYGDNGKIGIGVKTPDSLFQVNGGLKFVTGRQGAGKVLVSDANGGADWQTFSGGGGGGSTGTPINLEQADYSANTTITLNHTALPNTVILIKNGIILPPFKFTYSGAVIQLIDSRVSSDIFLTNYKY